MYDTSFSLPSSLRIGVLRGGPSPEYTESLATGAFVLKHLSETHRPVDIFISQDGQWHIGGIERSPERVLKNVDVVWNALHGVYGEDGQVQQILHGVPHTGSGAFASAVAMNKHLTKERAKSLGIRTPISVLVRQNDSFAEKTREVFNGVPSPFVVKPSHGGWAKDVHFLGAFAEVPPAIESLLSVYPSALVEERIVGKLVSCNVVDNFRGQKTYAFPPVVVGEVALSHEEKQTLENIAKRIHAELGLSHYCECDFIVSPRRGIYFLEVNTLPDISEKSNLKKSLDSVGSSVKEFLHHVLGLALNKK